jgi:hypothetical protein
LPPDVAALLRLSGTLLILLALGLAVVAMGVRWRRGDRLARAQLKWLLGALAVGAVLFPLSFGGGVANVLDIVGVGSAMLVPISIAIAILRYRLYDIDRIISRTISYGVVSVMLVAVYGGLILVLQGPLGTITGGETVAVAASTLVAAALFQPIRRRTQAAVDHRFNRARYDAERTIDALAMVLRDEMDLPIVRSAFVDAVKRSVQPTAASLWLRAEQTQ